MGKVLCLIEYLDRDQKNRAIELMLDEEALEKGFDYAKTTAALAITSTTKQKYIHKVKRITRK